MPRPTRGIVEQWLEVCRLLNRHGVDYVVVGGVASALHGSVRATKDIDVLVPRNLENTERLLEALAHLPLGLARELDPARENAKVITIIGDDPRVDVLKAAGELSYQQASGSKLTATIRGIDIPYASLPDLVRSKRTNRPRDQAEAAELEALHATQQRDAQARVATRPARAGTRAPSGTARDAATRTKSPKR